ncbi:family 78 glycoside hydrolase catalytic domain [Tichowtungia aerotolerans]|uniref:Family 78 glycoside hydrolase catalytic domain n=1 Tax=Tichowtungia aerotolerans TaxID=2697043 RepID=A0A6P1M8A6_9BACT|nr:family 78 glycoside hydrolase catalytic domain [Tichowtungia aerotolerans]QHI68754.1 family 78 glycoside hydrolase catalytic domain [Tichowtungia aerotolerans]
MSAEQTFQILTAPGSIEPDSHFYFRGRFSLAEPGAVRIKLLAANWFEAWLDKAWLAEGPSRFDLAHPEFRYLEKELPAGEHLLAFHVHYQGVETRLMPLETPMFVFAEIEGVEIDWSFLPLDEAYRKTGRRLDCILGWTEWCRTDKLPAGWRERSFDDSAWQQPVARAWTKPIENFQCLEIGEIRHVDLRPEQIGEGVLVNMSMFTHDPTAGFMARHLDDKSLPPQGKWFRFDLGKVRLGRPSVTVTAPSGSVVQMAYAESLTHGRVSPYISSSAGDLQTCNLDHFVLRGGTQTVKPLHPKGGRFVEVHIFGDEIADVDVVFEERVYYPDPPEGSFSCSDELLNRIWTVGVETLRSCSEDAITDNPTRERGQWLGDAVGAGMDILACSYSDMRPLKRGLIQAAQCAADDGLIPAVFPGTLSFLPSFSVQWVAAVPHYVELSGDFQTLEKLYPAAVANIRSFDSDLSDDGLCMNPTRWNFIDWGYRGSSTGFTDEDEHYVEMDPALSLFYLKALQALIRWAELLGNPDDVAQWKDEEQAFRLKVDRFLKTVDGNPADWEKIGYHAAALALGSGLLAEPERRAACVNYIKQHILSCFPNRPDAPRLYDTTVEASQLITPFFAHHVFPPLIEAGEMEFALEQFRVCWGYWLDAGLTTWPEVFDLRWSHCHQWSGCPTWILSRYVLGLHPRYDLGNDHYDLRLEPGGLDRASGTIPVPYSDKTVSVSWKRTDAGIDYGLTASSPIVLHCPDGKMIQVASEYQSLI